MATAPFGAALESALKTDIQGGTLSMTSGPVVNPRFFCCISGTTVGVAKDPVGLLALSVTSVCAGSPVTADYSRSWSGSSTINNWSIAWGDGQTSLGAWPGAGSVVHPLGGYVLPGIYTVTLTVTDLLGATGVDTVQIEALDCTELPAEGGFAEMYAGCGDSGVWYTDTGGRSWENTGGGILDDVAIRDIKPNYFTIGTGRQELWAATEQGLYVGYRDYNGATFWEKIDLLDNPEVWAVCPSELDGFEVHVLGDVGGSAYLYHTMDSGETWDRVALTGDYEVYGSPTYDSTDDDVFERQADGTWTDINKDGFYGAVLYWNGDLMRTVYAPSVSGGGLWRWTGVGIAWNLVAGLEYPTDMCVMSDGNLAVIEADACNSHEPPVMTPTVRIYNTLDVEIDNRPLPKVWDPFGPWWEIHWYFQIIEHEGDLFVGRRYCSGGGIEPAIVRWNGAAWVVEWTLFPSTKWPRRFASQGGRLWAAMNGEVRALVRDDALGTWSWDAHNAPGQLIRVIEQGDELYGLTTAHGIIKRDDILGWQAEIANYVGGTETDFIWAGSWYISLDYSVGLDHDVRIARWDATLGAWEDEYSNATVAGIEWAARQFTRAGTGAFTIPTTGHTNLLSMSFDGLYVYVGLLTAGGNPVILRVAYDLSSVEVVYSPLAGNWGGVVCSFGLSNRVWIYGNFGAASKVLVSDDWGDTFTDITDGAWGAIEVVRPLLPNIYDDGDVVAILNVAQEAWNTIDAGTAWALKGATAFAAQCGARDWYDERNILIGRTLAGADHLQWSPNMGVEWSERSTGITALAPISAIAVTG